MLNRRHVLAAGTALPLTMLLSACAGEAPTSTTTGIPTIAPSAAGTPTPTAMPTATSTPANITPSKDLSGITVTGDATPSVKVPAPWAIEKTTVKVLKQGASTQIAKTGYVLVNYVGINGRTGKQFDTSYGKQPAIFNLGAVVKGFSLAISGQRVGSRILVGMTSADGYADGKADAGIEKGDNLVFVIDLIAAEFPEPQGQSGTMPAGGPQVTVGANGPTVTVPAGATKPTSLGVHSLVTGIGSVIKESDAILLRYRSFTWDGKVFEDAWATAQAGKLDGVIAGWKQGIVGRTLGSRLVLVIPPALAYPAGRPKAQPTLGPGETLIYVMDLQFAAPGGK